MSETEISAWEAFKKMPIKAKGVMFSLTSLISFPCAHGFMWIIELGRDLAPGEFYRIDWLIVNFWFSLWCSIISAITLTLFCILIMIEEYKNKIKPRETLR